MDGSKVNKFMRFTPIIDIQKFIHPHSEHNQGTKYKLVGLISHVGRQTSRGHYVSIAQASGMQFYKFDDSKASMIMSYVFHIAIALGWNV